MVFGVGQNGQEVIKDECWIFDIVFECNSLRNCAECKYKEKCYVKFQRCFDNEIPCGLWMSVTCFDHLTKYINEWREYQNEQTTKQ